MNAMLFEEFHVTAELDPEPLAKSLLRDAIEQVTVGQVGEGLLYANSRGAYNVNRAGGIEEYSKNVD